MSARTVAERLSWATRLLVIAVVACVLAALVVVLRPHDSKRYITADFPRTISLYEGSDVRILGVPVGTVESIQPRGDSVRVRLSYDAKYHVPADAKAVIVSPAIIGDRYVQLTPAYDGGKTLANHAFLGEKRTRTPVELDEVFQSLDDLSVALGPKGANDNGALQRLLKSGSANLDGQGAKLNQTITDVSKLTGTLADNKDELFGSLKQVNSFVAMLKANDANVRAFSDSLTKVSSNLSGEREDLRRTIKLLAGTLADVNAYVKQNRSTLHANVHDLTELSKVLVKNRSQLKETLRSAPTALSNLAATYNPKTGTLDNRPALPELLSDIVGKPGTTLCYLLGGSSQQKQLCSLLKSSLPELGILPSGQQRVSPGRAAPASPDNTHTTVEGLLGVGS